MALAHLIREAEGRPVRYFAHATPWAELLELDNRQSPDSLPSWRHWSSVFAFLSQVIYWTQKGGDEKSAYLQGSEARTLFEEHQDAFDANRIHVPNPRARRGEAYLNSFRETIQVLAGWISENV